LITLWFLLFFSYGLEVFSLIKRAACLIVWKGNQTATLCVNVRLSRYVAVAPFGIGKSSSCKSNILLNMLVYSSRILHRCNPSRSENDSWLNCRPTTNHFLNQENSAHYLQRSCAHHSTKYGRISIRVPLWLPVRGPNFYKTAGQNKPTYPEIHPQQSKTYQNFSKRNCKEKINTTKLPQCDSVIGLHLLQNKQFANNYNDQQSSILARAKSTFHLSALKATYIKP